MGVDDCDGVAHNLDLGPVELGSFDTPLEPGLALRPIVAPTLDGGVLIGVSGAYLRAGLVDAEPWEG